MKRTQHSPRLLWLAEGCLFCQGLPGKTRIRVRSGCFLNLKSPRTKARLP